MNIQSFNHCGMVVADLEKSRWFYGTVLGMAEVPRPKNFKFAGAWFRSGSFEIHLLLATKEPPAPGFGDVEIPDRPAYATHLAVVVDDFDTLLAILDEHNIEIKFGPLARGDGMMQVFIHDPDGYLLEVNCWKEGSEVDAPERSAI